MAKQKKDVVIDEREVIAAFACDDQTRSQVGAVMGKAGLNAEMAFGGGIAASVRALGAMPCPHILVVDLSDSSTPKEDILSLAEVCDAGTLVVALGTINDVAFYRDLMTVGVQDYLVKPFEDKQIAETIAQCIEILEADGEEEEEGPRIVHSRQVLCVGVRGGMGTSMLTSNLSWLSAQKKINTVMLDFDAFFGTGAMNFGLEPGRGLPDALENPARVDGLFLDRAVIKPMDKLSVLAAEAPIGMIPDPSSQAVETLMNALGDNFDCVIADVPRQFLATHADLLGAATDIVLVTDLSLTAARDCIRLLSQIKTLAPDAEVHLVANRIGPVNEVSQKDFENTIDDSLDLIINEDRKGMIAATQKGKVMLETDPSSKFSSSIKELFAMIHQDEKGTAENGSWFSRLLGK